MFDHHLSAFFTKHPSLRSRFDACGSDAAQRKEVFSYLVQALHLAEVDVTAGNVISHRHSCCFVDVPVPTTPAELAAELNDRFKRLASSHGLWGLTRDVFESRVHAVHLQSLLALLAETSAKVDVLRTAIKAPRVRTLRHTSTAPVGRLDLYYRANARHYLVDVAVLGAHNAATWENVDELLDASLDKARSFRVPESCLVRKDDVYEDDNDDAVDDDECAIPEELPVECYGIVLHWDETANCPQIRISAGKPTYQFVLPADIDIDVATADLIDMVHALRLQCVRKTVTTTTTTTTTTESHAAAHAEVEISI
ncbi:hypothetical protein H9P43_001570 [Blastocladiella emersonii ATCC 22665]|nr:hypothetical protein H9P43_001570 [Blastocladiella emersonii ATCC 22665]